MSRRPIDERHIRTLSKNESSYSVTLPIEAIRDLGWQKNQKLVIHLDKEKKEITVTDWEE